MQGGPKSKCLPNAYLIMCHSASWTLTADETKSSLFAVFDVT